MRMFMDAEDATPKEIWAVVTLVIGTTVMCVIIGSYLADHL